MTPKRNGAQVLLQTAQELGIRVCFANPGTTELALVRALDDAPLVRPVLGLFEGVCTGAADGYARVSGFPALTLLHLGPGLANGLANLHNARRAHTPVINIVGDHATWHLPFDAPLTSDIDSLAKPVSTHVIHLTSAVSENLRDAVQQSIEPPGSVVTVVAPSDVMENPTSESTAELPKLSPERQRRTVPAEHLSEVARRVLPGTGTVLLLGSDALTAPAQDAAMRVAQSIGGRLIMESYPAIVELGRGLPRLERLAYFPQDVLAQLGDSLVVLVGARAPVSYFGYEGQPSQLVPAARVIELSAPGEDSLDALKGLIDLLGEKAGTSGPETSPLPARETNLTPAEVTEALVTLIPEGTIVSLEGSSCGAPFLKQAHRARRHRVMTNTGGAIGQGIPCAVGAAIASPSSRIVCLQSDGSAQYTLQALWTLAREQLNVVVVICANHRYGILQTELKRGGADMDRPAIERLTRLDQPRLDWVALAKGYGVPATRVATSAAFHEALGVALATQGPHLLEAQVI